MESSQKSDNEADRPTGLPIPLQHSYCLSAWKDIAAACKNVNERKGRLGYAQAFLRIMARCQKLGQQYYPFREAKDSLNGASVPTAFYTIHRAAEVRLEECKNALNSTEGNMLTYLEGFETLARASIASLEGQIPKHVGDFKASFRQNASIYAKYYLSCIRQSVGQFRSRMVGGNIDSKEFSGTMKTTENSDGTKTVEINIS